MNSYAKKLFNFDERISCAICLYIYFYLAADPWIVMKNNKLFNYKK